MKIHPAAQGTVDWLLARSAIPTASEFGQLVTPKFKVRTGDMPKTYLYEKLAEWWQGGPLPSFQSANMEFGNILEERAIPWYELQHGVTIQRVGLCLTDDGKVGCSPDGLIGMDGGIEFKCPAAHTQVRRLMEGELPDEYAAQVHGSMYVTGRPWWKFVSYASHFPKYVLHVERDEVIQEAIAEAIDAFLTAFEAGKARMIEINGGPPERKPLMNLTPAPEPGTWNNADPNDQLT